MNNITEIWLKAPKIKQCIIAYYNTEQKAKGGNRDGHYTVYGGLGH